MAKKSAVGQIIFFKETPKKRPGRHRKKINKHQKRRYKKYRGQGR